MNQSHTGLIQTHTYEGNPVFFELLSPKIQYVNATKVASAFDRRPVKYLQLEATKRYISTLLDALNCSGSPDTDFQKWTNEDLVCIKRGNTIQGTWLHRDLALDFARWLSPKFAIWMDRAFSTLIYNVPKLMENDVILQEITDLTTEKDACHLRLKEINKRFRELQVLSLNNRNPTAE